MNPIEFIEFIRDLERFLLSGIPDEDHVEVGRDIGRLLAGMDAINKVIARAGFWENYVTWKKKNE